MKPNGELKIRHDIPIPDPDFGKTGPRLPVSRALRKMQVGDCIDVYDRTAKNLYPRAYGLGIAVAVRTLTDKEGKKFLRVWRKK